VATVLDLPTLDTLRDEQRALRARLGILRRRLHLQLALEFAADAVIALTAVGSILVLLDWWFRPGLSARLCLLVPCLAAVLVFLGYRALLRWKAAGLDELSLAVTLDRYRPGVGQHVADVLQLPNLLDDSSISSSPAMVRLAVRQACSALASSDWQSLWNRQRTTMHAGAIILALLVPLVFLLAAPNAARLSLARWLLGSSERWPQNTYLTVMGLNAQGRLLAPRDERFAMEVRTDLPLLEQRGDRWTILGRDVPLSLRWKPEHPRKPDTVQVRERTAEGASRAAMMVEADPVRFGYEFPPESSSSTFELQGGDDWLGPLTVERVDRPALAETRLKVKEPGASYTGFRSVDDPRQHLLFLPDTEIELTLVGTEPLSATELKVHPGSSPELKRIDERAFSAHWLLREATTLEILLTSRETGLASKPAFLSIGLLRDREPRVTVRALGVGAHVTPVATIPLTLGATDDIGLAALRIQIERVTNSDEKAAAPRSTRSTINLPLPAEKGRAVLDQQVRHDLLLQSDPPRVGTMLRLVGEAEDRCVRGAQIGRSSLLQLQVVAPDELFYEILIRQRAERAKFLTVLETTEKQSPVLAGDPMPEDLLRVMRAEHSGSRQLDQIASRIADTLQEMKLNQIGSPKSHRLLQEGVIDPLRALSTGPMSQLRSVLQALSGTATSPGATKDAARRLQNEIVTKMKGILEQMSQWESFVDVVNQVAEVIKMEQKVLQATEKARESRTQEVFDDKP
jgi:hypothetical protein